MDNDGKYSGLWILYAMISGSLWLLLIVLKVFGVVRLGWIAVILGGLWIPTLILLLSAAACLTLMTAAKLKRKYRHWKVKRRIERQKKTLADNQKNAGEAERRNE